MTPAVTSADLAMACRRAAQRMRDVEQELNAADARLGDGDTGQTLRRLFDTIERAAAAPPEDIGAFLRALAMAGSGATGSSLGTLLVIGFMEAGKTAQGRTGIDLAFAASMLEAATAAMGRRGGAEPGDKTVLDSVRALCEALADGRSDLTSASQAARGAAHGALAAFRDRPCRIGRARMYSDKSIGLDDPGMLAFAYLVEAVATPSDETGAPAADGQRA